jgi:hypothetical protein
LKTVTTKQGTVLPLLNLKGKDYLMIMHRMVWFTEEISRYTIDIELPVSTADETLAKCTVTVLGEDGAIARQVTDYKREHKVHFADHTEKACSGSLGRCLAQLGYGTAYALADLDEGIRLADSPAIDTKPAKTISESVIPALTPPALGSTSFRKPNNTQETATVATISSDGWK